jgi:hypothetical protein
VRCREVKETSDITDDYLVPTYKYKVFKENLKENFLDKRKTNNNSSYIVRSEDEVEMQYETRYANLSAQIEELQKETKREEVSG